MDKYIFLHKLEEHKNYQNRLHNDKKKDTELAEFIFTNYNKMDDNELKVIALKCMDLNDVRRTLLSFELNYYSPSKQDKELTLREFKCEAMQLLNRYQCKGGGFMLEDSEWAVHDCNSVKYNVEENELLFENTINLVDKNDYETDNYLDLITNRLNLLSNNIEVEIRQKQHDYEKVISILLWATDKNVYASDSIVGL